jgi:DNA helicase II / ATP-dependent DNA helicase PcrA
MAISCKYCGGSHANPQEVRACWQRNSGGASTNTPQRAAAPTPAPRRQPSSASTGAQSTQPPPTRPQSDRGRPSQGVPSSRSGDEDRRGVDELRDLGLLPPFPDNDPGDEYGDSGDYGDPGGYVPPGDFDDPGAGGSFASARAATPSRPRSSSSASSRGPAAEPLDLSGFTRRGERALAGAGPDALGRNLIIDTSSTALATAVAGSAWADATVIVIEQASLANPSALVVQLAERAAQRQRTVFDLRVAFDEPPAEIDDRPLHEIGAHFVFEREQLHHLLWSNSVDGRIVDAPRWGLLDEAVELGATPVDRSSDSTTAGDMVLPDGQAAWLDGGPVAIIDVEGELSVVHRIALEYRSLAPLGTNEISGVELASDQLAAVTHAGGAARIIAPAGSGKTRVLTERARHLFNNWHVPTGAVSLVAFNVRAQNEMRERTTDLPGLQVRTLNAIALAIVNGSAPFAPQPNQRRTIDERDVRGLLDKLVEFPRRRNTDPVAPWLEALSMARLGLRDPMRVEASFSGDVAGFAEVFPRYRSTIERQGLVDFDEQIYRAIEILVTDSRARHAAQRASRLLLVDEFQDLTPAHLLLVRLLGSPDLAVFGVGDDDQTIYGYNGADPGSLIDFATLFPGAGDHPLEVNYRCPGGVVEIADRLLRHNRRRVPKTIRAAHGDTVGWSVTGPEVTSLDGTVSAVSDAIEAGTAPNDIAVLCRVNALLAPVQIGLQVRSIPTVGGVGPEFIERTAVRATLAWLRLASGLWLGADLGEALKRPSRPLHPRIGDWVRETNRPADLDRLAARLNTPRDAERVQAFGDDIASLRDLVGRGATTERVLESLYRKIGLASSVSALDAGRQGTNRGAQDDDLTAMAQLATLQNDPAQFPSWLAARFDRNTMSRATTGDGVTLSTVHRVKGQEWPMVVIHEASSNQFPHRLAEDLEEERRLFHVAITRGAAQVVIVPGDDPSPFIVELTVEPSEHAPTNPLIRRDAAPDKSTRTAAPGASTLSDKTVVIAVPGLVLSDQGTEWTIESVDESGAAARSGTAARRFVVGSKIGTAGGRNGKLRLLTEADPSATCVRADDALRKMRRLLAQGKPAFTVFDDATIERLALALPTTLEALARIAGIGPVKLERYGDAVIVAIEDALIDPTESAVVQAG